MKAAAAALCLLACAAAASAAAPAGFCPDGWAALTVAEPGYLFHSYMDLATELFIAANGTLPCPDSYTTDLLAGCSQAAHAGTEYRLLIGVGCESEAAAVPTTDLLATIRVPLPPNDEELEVDVSEWALP